LTEDEKDIERKFVLAKRLHMILSLRRQEDIERAKITTEEMVLIVRLASTVADQLGSLIGMYQDILQKVIDEHSAEVNGGLEMAGVIFRECLHKLDIPNMGIRGEDIAH
jgi:hypothetical protein